MNYSRFLMFNVVGAFLWTSIFIFGGYYFGNIPFIKRNFEIAILAIILISIIPILYETVNSKRKKKE